MVHLVNDTNGRRQCYQSSWMSRWMRTSCCMTGESLDYSSTATVNDLNFITKDIPGGPRSVKELGIIETVTSELVNGSRRMSAQGLTDESSCSYLFKNADNGTSARVIYLKNDIHFQPVCDGFPAASDTSFRGCHFLDAVTSKNNPLDHAHWKILHRKDRDLPSQLTAKTESKKLCFECYSLHKLPRCDHAAEPMKISTTLDSVEGGLSQSSNILLITANSASLLTESDILTTRRVFSKLNRNIPSDLHRLSPFPGQGKQGVILEPLTCSSDSEGRGNAGDIKTSRVTLNKVSSAETDTTDMNFSKEMNWFLGGQSASSDKVFHVELNSDSGSSTIPGLVLEIPMECADQTKQNSNLYMDNSPKAELGNRWVKRLKLNSSQSSARATKNINFAENSSRKRNNLFSKILENDITRSESTPRIHHGEESTALDKSINLSKENLGNHISLSHVWMQRWMRDGSKSTRKKPCKMVDCEPQGSKCASEDVQKDRIPNIRAMALTGKAIKSFRSCQLEKRGCSLTVWKTKAV